MPQGCAWPQIGVPPHQFAIFARFPCLIWQTSVAMWSSCSSRVLGASGWWASHLFHILVNTAFEFCRRGAHILVCLRIGFAFFSVSVLLQQTCANSCFGTSVNCSCYLQIQDPGCRRLAACRRYRSSALEQTCMQDNLIAMPGESKRATKSKQ